VPAPVRLICNNGGVAAPVEIAFNYDVPRAEYGHKTTAKFVGPRFVAVLEITRLNEIEGSSYRPPFAVRILMTREGSTFNGGHSGYCSTTTSLKRWISKNSRELSKIYGRR
jgi:hypothetical protein